MARIMAVCMLCAVLLVVASGATYAASFTTWTNPATTNGPTNLWDCATNWSGGTIPTAADNVVIPIGMAYIAGTGNSRTVGAFRSGNTGYISFGNNFTLTCDDSLGQSGDFFWQNTANKPVGTGYTLNVDGNLWIGALYWVSGVGTINLYGTNKAVHVDSYDAWSGYNATTQLNVQNIYGSYYDNASTRQRYYVNRNTVDVKVGGQIIRRPGANSSANASTWAARRFIFEGGSANLPALGDCVTFIYQPANEDNGPAGSNRLVIAGGVTYPMDVFVGADYWGAKPKNDATYTWRFVKSAGQLDMTVGRDFRIDETAGQSADDGMFVNFEENGTLNKLNVRVLRNMTVGTASAPTNASSATRGATAPTFIERYGMRGKNSTIQVGGDFTVGTAASAYYAWWPQNGHLVDLGNATIRVGGNFVVNRMDATAKAFWSGGTSTLICDGNGTGKAQLIRTWGISDGVKLNNLVIRNPGGTVTLDNNIAFNPAGLDPRGNYPRGNGQLAQGGDLLLSGNLSVECGTFITGTANTKGRQIAFNGPNHTIYVDPSAIIKGTVGNTQTNGVFDNMILLQNSQVTLLSSIAISTTDNFLMYSGSKLYLNGFTLTAYGQQYVSANVSELGIPFTQFGSNGTIFGTMVVPEPATLLFLGTGLLGGIGWLRRKRLQ